MSPGCHLTHRVSFISPKAIPIPYPLNIWKYSPTFSCCIFVGEICTLFLMNFSLVAAELVSVTRWNSSKTVLNCFSVFVTSMLFSVLLHCFVLSEFVQTCIGFPGREFSF